MEHETTEAEIKESEITPPTQCKQTVVPGSVSEDDLEKIFNTFVEWVGWDDPTCIPAAHKELAQRRDRYEARKAKLLARLTAEMQALNDKLSTIAKELRSSEEKRLEARAYLQDATTQMGMFASMEALTVVMRKRFPKVIIRPSARGKKESHHAESPGTPPPATAGTAASVVLTQLQDSLDHEGMTLSQIKEALKLRTTIDPKEATGLLKMLMVAGKITASVDRPKIYKLV